VEQTEANTRGGKKTDTQGMHTQRMKKGTRTNSMINKGRKIKQITQVNKKYGKKNVQIEQKRKKHKIKQNERERERERERKQAKRKSK
jgi:hypothetical protein